MKEAQMVQPNEFGHYSRDIASVKPINRWWAMATLSCGHELKITRHAARKWANDALWCIECSQRGKS
jgi:hypothetical protein